MSATAALAPPPPPPPSQHASMLSLGSSTSSLIKRSTESPPTASSKTPVRGPSPVHQAPPHQSPPRIMRESPTPQMQSKTAEVHKLASPAPVKLPETAPPVTASPPEPVVTPPLAQPFSTSRSTTATPNNKNTISEQAPAQLALLLSSALADTDALRRELALEKKRAARAERLLSALQAPASPDSVNTGAESRNVDGRLQESAAKAVVDAEARTEQAERARDDALHALASLLSSFAELERYEAACALRASDARGVYSRLLASLAPHPSPALSTSSPRDELRLNLPGVPAPLPSLPLASQLLGPGTHLPTTHTSAQSSRFARPLPLHSTYVPVHSPRQSSVFDSLPLPPPPSASGLGSMSINVPSKRTHGHRSRTDEAGYDEQKRRRLGPVGREMDVDMAGADAHSPYAHRTPSRHPSLYQSGPTSAQPLSAHPTSNPSFGPGLSPPSTIYDRPPSVQYPAPPAPGQSFHREGLPSYAPPPSSGSRHPVYDEREREYAGREREGANIGLGRVDARELVRDAKARERRGRERESYVRHPQSQVQAQSQGALHTGERGRRSASRSSLGSKSSLSLDEMLLETATDRERGRPSPSEQSAFAFGVRQSQNQNHNYGTISSSVNGASPPYTTPAPPSTAHSIARTSSVHTPAANGVGRKPSVPASQLMTLGPSGAIVSGGGDLSASTSMDPAVRFPGLRTCRQCGLPGRYKEGKCVEKWGPGPQGPGTVCDRCRKKMKRVERRGTLDAAAPGSGSLRANQSQTQKASHSSLPSAHSQSYSQPYTQPQPASRARAPARTDTLIVETEQHPKDRSRSPASRYHASVPAASASARHPSLASHTHHLSSHSQSQPQSRRAPTPPYITSISSREQYDGPVSSNARLAPPAGHRTVNGGGRPSRASSAEGEDDLLEDEGDAEAARAANGNAPSLSAGARMDLDRDRAPAAPGYAHSYARQTHGEQDELEDDADADVELDADADADGSGIADADAEAEADADADIMDAVDATMKVED